MRDRRTAPVQTRGRGRPEGQRGDKNRASVDSNTSEDQCHPRKVFIGGLAHKTTTQHLRDHFGRFGSIVDAVVLRWPDGRSRGFGYVTFADGSAANGVLKETHSLSGREVDVKRAVPGTNKLFIGGLPQNTTANELREHFEKFGVVSDAVVMIDPATSRSRGFGFVCFLPGQEGATAVTSTLSQYENHRMRGKWIEVKSAAPPHKLAATAKAQEVSYEELALSGALQNPLDSPQLSASPEPENREPNRKRSGDSAPALGSPRKVELPGGAELGNNNSPVRAPPPGLAQPMRANGFASFKPNDAQNQMPWWGAQPWPQPFGPGFGLSGYPQQQHAPFGGFEQGAYPPFGAFQFPPYADQPGLSVSDTLQRNLEQFLRQSDAASKGTATPRDPSVSTTCSAATPTETARLAELLP